MQLVGFGITGWIKKSNYDYKFRGVLGSQIETLETKS